ncbi:MAG: rubrerythrin family protein [Clostridia bacterium]|nr:rubrerythrin family protein [Clostridia bacterium]
MEIKNSRTYKNLINSFAGECMDHVRYKFMAYGAKTAKLYEVQCALKEMADNEFHHARMFYTEIQNADPNIINNLTVNAGYPFKEKWDLKQNLELAAQTEYDESVKIYAEYAAVAHEEGFEPQAKLFELVAVVEHCHMMQLNNIRQQLCDGTMYKRAEPVKWKCSNCGHEETGLEAPTVCPLCKSEQGYVKLELPDN